MALQWGARSWGMARIKIESLRPAGLNGAVFG
jgi:hypothetical protein